MIVNKSNRPSVLLLERERGERRKRGEREREREKTPENKKNMI
jgi:hypothetical protein